MDASPASLSRDRLAVGELVDGRRVVACRGVSIINAIGDGILILIEDAGGIPVMLPRTEDERLADRLAEAGGRGIAGLAAALRARGHVPYHGFLIEFEE